MNRSERATDVPRQVSLPKSAADRVVGAVITAIGDALARGEPVTIAGFGALTARQRPARQGRNRARGTRVDDAPVVRTRRRAGKLGAMEDHDSDDADRADRAHPIRYPSRSTKAKQCLQPGSVR